MTRIQNKSAMRRLGVGFVGSGFNARFHMQALRAVRDADVRGVWSPNEKHAESAAALARSLDIGDAQPFASITDMVADPAIDALWLTGPNHTRVENFEEIVHALERGRGTLRGVACEKPLARTVAEATHIILRTRFSRRRYRPAVACCGRAARQRRADRILRAPPKSTAVRTCRGSGAETCKVAACSTT